MPIDVQIQLDNNSMERLQRRFRRLINAPLVDVLTDISAQMVSQTQRRISTEKTAPDGTAWQAWSANYASSRHDNQSLLVSDGHLMGDIQFNIEGDTAIVGSSLKYAATQHFGRDNIPARPFLGVSQDNEGELLDILDNWIDRLLQ